MLRGAALFGIVSANMIIYSPFWLDIEGRKRLRHFAPVGRMALTNYVGQSVICTLIF